MQNKKVLFVATVPGHINTFHIPYLKLFKDKGYEVHVASNRNDDIKYCDRKIIIPIKRSPYKISNLKAIKEYHEYAILPTTEVALFKSLAEPLSPKTSSNFSVVVLNLITPPFPKTTGNKKI